MIIKKFIILVTFLILISSNTNANNNVFIVTKVNDNILTNLDIKKEISYLKILNPQVKELTKEKIFIVAKNTLINEIIKKNEVKNFFKFDTKIKAINEIYKDLYNSIGFSSDKEFEKILLKNNSYTAEEIEEKLKIEFFWNRIILEKYEDKVRIDEKKLIEKINNIDEYKNEYLLSEIFFNKDKNLNLKEKINKIKQSIEEVGFNNTATIFSISESASKGGKIGWIEENSLSKKIIDELKKIKINEYSNTIQFGNNFLILKIEDKKTKKIETNKEKILEKMILFEKNKQLNQFANIYFNKIKINYKLNEN